MERSYNPGQINTRDRSGEPGQTEVQLRFRDEKKQNKKNPAQ